MKQVFTFTLIVSFFVLMLCFPQITFSGASRGLLLWFQVLLPTLLPFMILSNLLIRTNYVFYISRFLKPFFKRVFHISDTSCYVVFVGFLCGYPLGAKTAADCVRLGQISKEEGQYLLSFANNSSLMYIISFLVMQTFKDASLTFASIAILFASPILCSFFFRRSFIKHSSLHSTALKPSSLTLHFHILDDSIMNSFEALTKIGGYVILFSILFSGRGGRRGEAKPPGVPSWALLNALPLGWAFNSPLESPYLH